MANRRAGCGDVDDTAAAAAAAAAVASSDAMDDEIAIEKRQQNTEDGIFRYKQTLTADTSLFVMPDDVETKTICCCTVSSANTSKMRGLKRWMTDGNDAVDV